MSLSSPQFGLPSPNGPLLSKTSSTAISAANKEVKQVMVSQSEDTSSNTKREDVIRSTHKNRRPP